MDLHKWNNTTFGDYLIHHLNKYANSLITDTNLDETISYGDLLEIVINLPFDNTDNQVAHIFLENGIPFSAAYVRLQMIGAVTVATHPASPKLALENALTSTGSEILVTSSDLYEKFNKDIRALNLRTIYILSNNRDSNGKYAINVQKIKHSDSIGLSDDEKKELENVADLFMTSGSTGKPKAVMKSHYSCIYCCENYATFPFLRKINSKFMSCQPFAHGGGRLYTFAGNIVRGAHIIIMPTFSTSRDVLSIIHKHEPEICMLFPSLISALLLEKRKEEHFPSIKNIFTAGASPKLYELREFADNCNADIEVIEGYGSTESSLSHYGDGFSRKLKVRNPQLFQTKIGKDNELLTKSQIVAKGYFKDKQKTRNMFDENGFYHTGDVVDSMEDGSIIIRGRIKDMIKFREFPVHSVELEQILMEHSNICDCAVIGRSHAVYGEIPIAYVVCEEFNAEDIIQWVKDRVPEHKQLHEVIKIDKIPTIGNHKIDKVYLRRIDSMHQ